MDYGSPLYVFKKVISESTLAYEEIITLLKSVEACLNSRPPCSLYEDPSDFQVLTPASLILGRQLMSVPEESSLLTGLSPRWKSINQLRDDFWQIWSKEYLQSLQVRSKWFNKISLPLNHSTA